MGRPGTDSAQLTDVRAALDRHARLGSGGRHHCLALLVTPVVGRVTAVRAGPAVVPRHHQPTSAVLHHSSTAAHCRHPADMPWPRRRSASLLTAPRRSSPPPDTSESPRRAASPRARTAHLARHCAAHCKQGSEESSQGACAGYRCGTQVRRSIGAGEGVPRQGRVVPSCGRFRSSSLKSGRFLRPQRCCASPD